MEGLLSAGPTPSSFRRNTVFFGLKEKEKKERKKMRRAVSFMVINIIYLFEKGCILSLHPWAGKGLPTLASNQRKSA